MSNGFWGAVWNVILNLVANLVFWLLLGVFVFALLKYARRWYDFFGPGWRRRGMRIYVSNLATPDPGRHRNPFAVGANELAAAQAIPRIFDTTWERVPNAVRGLVDGFWVPTSLVVTTCISPLRLPSEDVEELDPDVTLIVIGGAKYNRVRSEYLRGDRVVARFSGESGIAASGNRVVVEVGSGFAPTTVKHARDDTGLAILEKVRDRSGRVVFFCAGEWGAMSRFAAEYLERNARALSKEFKDQPFHLVLEFSTATSHEVNYAKPYRAVAVGSRPVVIGCRA